MNRTARPPIFSIMICLAVMALVAVGYVTFGPSLLMIFQPGRVGRTFYIPSESMRPTLDVNDRIVPRKIAADRLKRGMIVVFQGPQEARVDRIAAVGGDVVALRDGVVIIDGHAATQRRLGPGPVLKDGSPTQLLVEQFPGENHQHYILDSGYSEGDDVEPVRVPPGFLYLLGDDRDRAADSRFSPGENGVGVVPVSAVIGQVDTLMWSGKRARIGRPIDTRDPKRMTRT